MTESVQCPVCTLYLHANMRLSDHLETHPKEQVIKALVALTISGGSSGTTGVLGQAGVEQKSDSDDSSKKKQPDQATTATNDGGTGTEHTPTDTTSHSSLLGFSSTIGSMSASGGSLTLKSESESTGALSVAMNPSSSVTTATAMAALITTTEIKTDAEFEAPLYHQQRVLKNVNASPPPPLPIVQGTSVPNLVSEGQVTPTDFSLFTASRCPSQQQGQQSTQQLSTAATSFGSLTLTQLLAQGHRSGAASHQIPTQATPPEFALVTNNSFQLPSQQQQQDEQQQNQQQQQNMQGNGTAAASTVSVGGHRPHPGIAVVTPPQAQQAAITQPLVHPLRSVYAANLPPPPPLQLFSYQSSPGHAAVPQSQHQKPPPPAYGTAISQIRSQHNQTKQHALIPSIPLQQQQPQLPAPPLIQHHVHGSGQQQTSPLSHIQQVALRPALPLQPAKESSSKNTTNFSVPPPPPPPPPPAHLVSPQFGAVMDQSSQLIKFMPHQQQQQQQQQTSSQQPTPPQQQTHLQQQQNSHQPLLQPQQQQLLQPKEQQHVGNNSEEAPSISCKPPSMSVPRLGSSSSGNSTAANQLSSSTSSNSSNSNNASNNNNNNNSNTATTGSKQLTRQSHSPIVSVTQPPPVPSSSPALSASSVLRFAESPVAHYLERDNGDFIVQETPKHIVECVEKDNGEFYVIERIYQSPPSVLRIHDENENENDDDDGKIDGQQHLNEPNNEHIANGSVAADSVNAERPRGLEDDDADIDDEEEFMSIGSDTEPEEIIMEKHNNKTTLPKRRRSAVGVNTTTPTLATATTTLTSKKAISLTANASALNSTAGSSSSTINSNINSNSSSNSSQTSSNSNSNQATIVGTGTQHRKTSKNTITVLSDVQLNHSEYLDLVGTFRKMSKLSQRQTTFSAQVPIPFVKVEKEEPIDDYENPSISTNDLDVSDHVLDRDEEQKGLRMMSTSCLPSVDDECLNEEMNDVHTPATINKKLPANANNQETDELFTSNRSRIEITHLQKGINHGSKVNSLNGGMCDGDSVGASGSSASQVTSVIRMASTSQHQQGPVPVQLIYTHHFQRDISIGAVAVDEKNNSSNYVPIMAETKDSSVAEDLSKPQAKQDLHGVSVEVTTPKTREQLQVTTRRVQLIPPKKGPKKLVIKPKATKMDAAHDSQSMKHGDGVGHDDKPCTSTKVHLQQRSRNRNDPDRLAIHEMQIKSEPNADGLCLAYNSFGSLLEQQLKPSSSTTSLGMVCKQEQVTDSMLTNDSNKKILGHNLNFLASRVHENVDDARVLLDFANSKKHNTTGVNFLSSSSIFSAAAHVTPSTVAADSSTSAPVSVVDGNSNQSMDAVLRCDDEFIATDGSDVQEIVISSSYSSQSASDVAVTNREDLSSISHTDNSKVHQYNQQLRIGPQSQPQQLQEHQPTPFTDYSFSFLYGSHQTAGQQTGDSGKMGFSPLYQAAQDNTTAATLASGSTSVTVDDSQTSAHMTNVRSTPSAMQQPPQLSRFGAAASASGAGTQWYNDPPSSGGNAANFEAALAVDCSIAVDGCSGVAGKYLDLDACKQENIISIQAAPPPSSSTSSSFTAATESSLAGGCTTDALNIRTDEKMPAKGEISEQESNCDIENSWSQPMYGDLSARFFKTSFPAFLQQENGWHNDEYFAVQDLSASTTAANASAVGTGSKSLKSFDFHVPLESNHNHSSQAAITDAQPSTSSAVTAKKKRKRNDAPQQTKLTPSRLKPTATITSQQLIFHQQQHQLPLQPQQQQHLHLTSGQQEFTFQLPAQHSLVVTGSSTVPGIAAAAAVVDIAAGCVVGPSTSAAAAAAAAVAATGTTVPATTTTAAAMTVATPKPRKKVYQCTHCLAEFVRLKDRNSHLIDEHNYVRHNRRLVCARSYVSTAGADLSVPPGNVMSTGSGGATAGTSDGTIVTVSPFEMMEDSKQGIVKIEMDNAEQAPSMSVLHSSGVEPKSEYVDAKEGFAFISANINNNNNNNNANGMSDNNANTNNVCSAIESVDTKPALAQPMSMTTPASKLAALYRMLVAFNVATLKQHTHLSEFEEKLIETSIFFCYVCRCNFTSVKQYDAHLTEHPAECFTCGKKFQRWKNFSLHLKRHLGWKEFGCSVCDKKFVVRSALVEHMRMHTGQTPLKCKICGKSFKRYSNLTQHRKRHGRRVVRKKEYVCHCGEVLPSKSRFIWHKETHDAKPKCCPYCCDRFVHANSLRRHIRLAHSDKFDYTEPMECPMCKQIFSKSSIKAHMATHSMETQHDCAICNKSFSTKWNLKMHSWVHANRTAKPFKCEHCPKAFVREVDLKNHMNAHKQIKPYTCEYCGCKFIRKYNYLRHRREHHGNKKFSCDFCKKSFHRHYYLIEHRRIHTGERPFVCTICGKSSTTKTNHNKHLKIHHSRDPFTVEA